MTCSEISRKHVATSKPMQDGLGNWYRVHEFEVTERNLQSALEWLTPEQAKTLLDIRHVPSD